MAGSEAHGSWHCMSSIFAIFCDSAEYGVTRARLSELYFFMKKNRKKSQVPLLMKNMV